MDFNSIVHSKYAIPVAVGGAGIVAILFVVHKSAGSSVGAVAGVASPTQYVGTPAPGDGSVPGETNSMVSSGNPSNTAPVSGTQSLTNEINDLAGVATAFQQLQSIFGNSNNSGSSSNGSTSTPSTPSTPAPPLANQQQGFTFSQFIGDLFSNPDMRQNASQQQHYADIAAVGRQFLPQNTQYQELIASGPNEPGANAQQAYHDWVNRLATFEPQQLAAEQNGQAPVVASGYGSASGYRQYNPAFSQPGDGTTSGGSSATNGPIGDPNIWGGNPPSLGGGGGVTLHRWYHLPVSKQTVPPVRPSNAALQIRGWQRYRGLVS